MSNADDIHAALRPLADVIARILGQHNEQPVPDPEPQPEPEPTPQPDGVSVQLYNSAGEEWVNGISQKMNRFILRDDEQARSAFKAGATVRFADGSTRRITKATVAYNAVFVEYDGERVDTAKVGYPNSVTAVSEGSAVEPTPKPEPAPVPSKPGAKRRGRLGTNLGMGQGHEKVVPGNQFTHFRLPVESEIIRAKSKGLTLFRIGGIWERVIRPGGKHELYLGKDDKGKPYTMESVMEIGRLCKKHGCQVMWNLFHNYGGYSSTGDASNSVRKKVGSSGGPSIDTFAQDWKAVILHIKSDPDVWEATYGFDTMNEWVGMPNGAETVFQANQRFLDVCAPIMDDKMAVIEGDRYSNTPNFWKYNPRFPELKDPRGPGYLEMSAHLYLDQDQSGFYRTGDTVKESEGVTHANVGVKRLAPFKAGLEKTGFYGSIGETIVPGDHPKLLAGLENMIDDAMDAGINVFIFGMGDGFSANAHHNLEATKNVPTMELVSRLAKAG